MATVYEDVDVVSSTDRKKRTKKKKNRVRRVLLRILLCFFTVIILVAGGLFAAVGIVNYGPSVSARNLLVATAMETSAAKFLATMFFTDAQIKEILAANTVKFAEEEVEMDKELIIVAADNKEDNQDYVSEEIQIVDVAGATYKGRLMIINDPSRVIVGVSGELGAGLKGKMVSEMIASYGGIGGTNAGGFEDLNGVGKGGEPIGIVISEGELKWGELTKSYLVIGFDKDNKFVAKYMTAQKALDIGMRDAVSFGPVLVTNGEAANVSGTGGGLNPRTAIGQRADGSVLLLVIDGRQANSLGATLSDLINVMLEYGAVNAANLDGGSSAQMIYEGELISNCASLYGPRNMPTAIVIK